MTKREYFQNNVLGIEQHVNIFQYGLLHFQLYIVVQPQMHILKVKLLFIT